MAIFFVDPVNGDDDNDGQSMDEAWATLAHAYYNVVLIGASAGDTVWVRRTLNEIFSSAHFLLNVSAAYLGLRIVGWPRASISCSTGTWTNGSTLVSGIDVSLSRGAHAGRWITGPDGNDYLITYVVTTNSVKIDREYSGASVSGSVASTIKEDEDYTEAQAIDDAAWTIKIADWDADSHALPIIDFNYSTYQMKFTSVNNHVKNFDIKNGSYASSGMVYLDAQGALLQGCLIQSSVAGIERVTLTSGEIRRCIIDGGSGTGAYGLRCLYSGPSSLIQDSAIFSLFFEATLVVEHAQIHLDNVNLGVERDYAYEDNIYLIGGDSRVTGIDVMLGGEYEYVTFYTSNARYGPQSGVWIENYQKVLGAHRAFTIFGTIDKIDVVAGSGDPEKRMDDGDAPGADSVICCVYDFKILITRPVESRHCPIIFQHEFIAAAASDMTFRYYCQADGFSIASGIWLEAEYIDAYDDATEYHRSTLEVECAVAERGAESDWGEYIEITIPPPAIQSKVRITCRGAFYDAAGLLYIDPLCEITP